MPEHWFTLLTDSLHQIRVKYNYFDEIHWREIKSASEHSKPFCVAREWLEYYIRTAIRGCAFKAFIAEDGPNRSFPYPGDSAYPEHLLKSTKAAFVGGIAWSFYRESKLRLDIVFDDTDSELDREIAERTPSIVQDECNLRRLTSTKRYPWTRAAPVRFVSSNPKEANYDDWPLSECIQLCDLLLGASFQALDLTRAPDKSGRRQLARSVLGVLSDTLKVPWFQQAPVHRRFSVSMYPDKYNFAYPAALRRITPRDHGEQLTLSVAG